MEIAKKFVQHGVKTIIAARNEEQSKKVIQELINSDGELESFLEFRPLDISSEESIDTFANALKSDYDHIDILVNNAAIAFKQSDPTPFREQGPPTFRTNYFGTQRLTEALFPLLRASKAPRVVNVASQAGSLNIIPSPNLKEEFLSFDRDNDSIEHLNALANKFLTDVQQGVHAKNGWPNSNYGMSKLALIALTKIWARRELPNNV